MERATLTSAGLNHVDLSGANLRGGVLSFADLTDATLCGADLTGAQLDNARLSRADLTYAKLNGADLYAAVLDRASLKHADLSVAGLRRSNLSYADLTGADLSKATVGWTTFGGNKLGGVVGLDSVTHTGPSIVGVEVIYEYEDLLPEGFLRGIGLPENFITYMPSLVGQPIQFYSCFISYSSKDQAIAERIHADLQSRGVRCWFAPEDLKIGDPFRDGIDESIRLHDKLLLILSENSVANSWVRGEVEAAFEREEREGRLVLFPIQIDTAVTECRTGWAADVRRTRHVGDFIRWKNHDSYQKAFDRLLRDLKAEGQSPT